MTIFDGIKDRITSISQVPGYINPFEIVHEHDLRSPRSFLRYLLQFPKDIIGKSIRQFIRKMMEILKEKDLHIKDVLVGFPLIMLQTILHPIKAWRGTNDEEQKKEIAAWEEKLDAKYQVHDDMLLMGKEFLKIENPDKYRDPEAWAKYSEIRDFIQGNESLTEEKKNKILKSMRLTASGDFVIQKKIYAVLTPEEHRGFMKYVNDLQIKRGSAVTWGDGVLGQKMKDYHIVPADTREFTQYLQMITSQSQTQSSGPSFDNFDQKTKEELLAIDGKDIAGYSKELLESYIRACVNNEIDPVVMETDTEAKAMIYSGLLSEIEKEIGKKINTRKEERDPDHEISSETAEQEIEGLKKALGIVKPGTYPIEAGKPDAKAAQLIKIISRVKTEDHNKISISFIAGAKNDKSKCYLGTDEQKKNYYIKLPKSPYISPDPLHDVIVAIPTALGYATEMNGGLKVDIPLNVSLNIVDENHKPTGKQLSVAQIVENRNIRISTIKLEQNPILLHNNRRMYSHTDNQIDYLLSNGKAYVFKNHNEAKDITIPDKVMYDGQEYPVRGICAEAFRNDLALETITLPSTIMEIGRQAFDSCTKLHSVTLQNPVTENIKVRERAFNSCVSLAKAPDCILKSNDIADDALKDTHVDNLIMPKLEDQIPMVEEIREYNSFEQIKSARDHINELYDSIHAEQETLEREREALSVGGNLAGVKVAEEKLKAIRTETELLDNLSNALDVRQSEITVAAQAEEPVAEPVRSESAPQNDQIEEEREGKPQKKKISRDLDISH